jgi:hypothetical protein
MAKQQVKDTGFSTPFLQKVISGDAGGCLKACAGFIPSPEKHYMFYTTRGQPFPKLFNLFTRAFAQTVVNT